MGNTWTAQASWWQLDWPVHWRRLADGRWAHLRAARAADSGRLLAWWMRQPASARVARWHGGVSAAALVQQAQPEHLDTRLWLLVHGDAVVAELRCARAGPGGALDAAVMVDASLWGQGIGGWLVGHLTGAARTAGATALLAHVGCCNLPMRQLLRRQGWEVEATDGGVWRWARCFV